MSKLSFRARALDPCKPMPIFLAEELPDLPEYSAINRAVPQMPSGMEKEEESEHHLQRAICTGLIIPTPEVFTTDPDFYERCYPANYKMPRQLIHMQPLGLEQDIPDYDMDSADELWMNSQARRLDLTPLKFEQMMDKLEKSSGQTVVTLNEAKALLRQDDEVSTAVYDYWLNKRLKTQHPLILSVKTENRSGTAANNPYLAFRRRTEKMQTRKNRKNDETSYEKMLKLRRDLCRAVTLLEMVKKREKTKREQLHLSIDIFEKRYHLRDFSGSLTNELSSSIKSSRPAFAPIYSNQYSHHSSSSQPVNLHTSSSSSHQQQQHHHYSTSSYHSSGLGVASSSVSTATKRDLDAGSRKEKRQYKKRKHKLQREKHYTPQNVASPAAVESTISSEEEDLAGSHLIGSEGEDEGSFSFRRNKNCEYHRPLTKGYGNWPWESKEENGLADPRYRFTLTSTRHPRPRCIGFARRRVGRGGRVILDRISTNADDLWSQLDYTIVNSKAMRKSETHDADTAKDTTTLASDDENVSRDMNYASSCLDRIVQTRVSAKDKTRHVKRGVDVLNSNYSDVVSYSNSYSNLCSRLLGDYEASYVRSNRENKIGSISDLLNKNIKQEILDDVDVSGDDWARLTKSESQSTVTSQEQRDADIVVDLVRAQCINRISNRNISNSNNNSHTLSYASGSDSNSASSRTLFNKQHATDEASNSYVIKDELTTVIKRECETETNNSDDDNVNLASLSNNLHATRDGIAATTAGTSAMVEAVKSEIDEKLARNPWRYDEPLTHSNFVDLNTSTKLLQNPEFWQESTKTETVVSGVPRDVGDQDDCVDKGNIYEEFLDEIRKNWLHFHPKSPPPEDVAAKSAENESKASVPFSEQTPISIELQRVDLGVLPPGAVDSPSSVFTPKIDLDPMFVTPEFSYADLDGDEQLLLSNTTTDSSNSGIDFNLSGDSLTELNLSLGEDENEKMLENILEECQIDDLKTLNQTTTFWDGILEDGGLLDVIDDKKAVITDSGKAVDLLVNGADASMLDDKDDVKRFSNKRKGNGCKTNVGCSQFTITNASQEEKFFSKEEPKPAHLHEETMKCEPPEELLEAPPNPPQNNPQANVPIAQIGDNVVNVMTTAPTTSASSSSQGTVIPNQSIKILIKQETPTSIVSSTPSIVTTINQVPINQLNASQLAVAQGINIKLKNDCDAIVANMIRESISSGATVTIGSNVGNMTGSIGGTAGFVSTSNNLNSTTTNVPSLLMTSIQQQQPLHATTTQQPQQHIIFRQITQSSQTPQVNASVGNYTTDGSGAIVIATSTASPTKRQMNGPGDNAAIQNLMKNRYTNRNLNFIQQTVKQRPQQTHMQIQQSQLHQDDEVVIQTSQKHQQVQSQLLKINQLPVIVPELNFQQQTQGQQSQQKNTISGSAAVAVAANHNYSLQPTAQPITIIGHQQQSGNKIILNTSGASGTVTGGTNFAIATPIQDLPTKIQYGQIPSSNIKVNLVTSSGIQQGSLIMDAKNSEMVKTSLQQHQQAQITVATGPQQGQAQHPARKTVNMLIDTDQKRVLCKLVNLSSLNPKNSAGQTVQVSSGAAAHLLNKAPTIQRIGNSAIVANVRTLAVSNQMIGTGTNAVAGTANANSIITAATQSGSGSIASGDMSSASHKNQTANSTVSGSGGGDTAASVVSSGINLNTTNR